MKSVTPSYRVHVGGEVTTLATIWRIERLDGQIFCFTDHDQDIFFNGENYEASSGYTAGAIKSTASLSVDNLELEGVISSEVIQDADLQAGLWDFAKFKISRVNYDDLSQGAEILRAGTLGNVRTGQFNFFVELRGMMQPLQQDVGRVYAPACDADLGDHRCKVNLAAFTVTGVVTDSITQSRFMDSSRGEAAGWFDFGLLTFTSGANEGYKMEVKTFSSGEFVLQQAMPNPISTGDAYSVYAGCDKLRETCKNKFNNVINFRGFPDVPGMDRMVTGK